MSSLASLKGKISTNYWRAPLAESGLPSPKVSAESKPIQIDRQDHRWFVCNASPDITSWIESQFTAANKSKKDATKLSKIPFVLIPLRLSSSAQHGAKQYAKSVHEGEPAICIPCLLDDSGTLWPDPERTPWIPRNVLEPSTSAPTIGELETQDQFLSALPQKSTTFEDVLKTADELWQIVTGKALICSGIEGKEVIPAGDLQFVQEWHGVAYEPPVIARHLIRLYDHILAAKPEIPLFEKLRSYEARPSRQPLTLPQSEYWYSNHYGHINAKHPLSTSQREAMVEFAQLSAGDILAVNGPPGTGKTTLLQSIVAQVWIDAALKKTPECPLILVTSTNAKAVENVLDSFAKIAEETGHKRWHPYDKGFGLFLASASRETSHPTCISTDQHEFQSWESLAQLEASERFFIDCAEQDFAQKQNSIAQVVDVLHARLSSSAARLKHIIALRYEICSELGNQSDHSVSAQCDPALASYQQHRAAAEAALQTACAQLEEVEAELGLIESKRQNEEQQANKSEQAWNTYLATTPLWLDFLAFLPPLRRRRDAKDRAFLLANPMTQNLLNRDQVASSFAAHRQAIEQNAHKISATLLALQKQLKSARNEAIERKQAAVAASARLEQLIQRWKSVLGDDLGSLFDVSLAQLNPQLDTLIRAQMFALADWYWTGRWLLLVRKRLQESAKDSKGKAKLEAMYRRFAMLSPCLVSNFHVVPQFFIAWQGDDMPLWNSIDLLIVDESGQVSPDVGAGVFSLAKKAVVVGDTHQIEPVWNTGEHIDRANAVKFGMTAHKHDPTYDEIAEGGYTPASGNLMRMANRACEVQKYPELRGLMLTEHRRCVPEIIGYCNDLIYGGRLEPKRASLAPEKNLFPPFGQIEVLASDEQIGTSRRNQGEARIIAEWIKAHRAEIESHYKKPISKLLGVVSPFKSQASLISLAVRKELPDLKGDQQITVGTVHALQGAERHIVIFSATYGKDYKGKMFCDQKPNMLNVAVSRAKDSFLVVGNLALFDRRMTSPSGLLARYLCRNVV